MPTIWRGSASLSSILVGSLLMVCSLFPAKSEAYINIRSWHIHCWPIVGRIVDTHGPRISLVETFVCCLAGYAGLKRVFDDGVAPGATLSSMHFTMLVLRLSFTGFGAMGLSCAVNGVFFFPLSDEHCVGEHL